MTTEGTIAPLPDMQTCSLCGALAIGYWQDGGLFVCGLCRDAGHAARSDDEKTRMANYVTVVVDEDTDDIIDVVDGDASAALALFSAVWPTTVDGEAAQHAAYQYVRAYLARNGFAPVAYVRVGLGYSQLYEGETPKP